MTTMVARGSSTVSTSIPIQERGSRNKRKFRADSPLTDLYKIIPTQPACPDYELAPVESASIIPNSEHHAGACDVCKSLTCGPRQEVVLEEFQEADWGDVTETQLEELVLSNLDMIFRTAIKKITSYGYTEDVALKAVLRSGVCYGCKDTMSNLVDHALAYLVSGQEVDSSHRENLSEDLQKLEKSVLAEMVYVLREVRPFFSMGDAMWCLLICDMNVSHACAMDGDPLSSVGNDEVVVGPSPIVPKPECDSLSSASSGMPECNAAGPGLLNPMLNNPLATPRCKMPTVVGIPNLPSVRLSALSNVHGASSSFNSGKESLVSSSYHVVEGSSSLTTSESIISEMWLAGGRKGHGCSSKRETILRQKSIHFEKSCRVHGSRSALRAGKLSSLGGLILDKKSRSFSDSTNSSLKNASLKVSKSVSSDKIQTDATLNLSFSSGPFANASLSSSSKSVCNSSPLPAANTELSLSLPSKHTAQANPKPDYSYMEASCSTSHASMPFYKNPQWVPQDEKDVLMLKLIPCVRELKSQLEEWSYWAQQKVMQAAHRLNRDKAELQTLRQEKEEVAHLKKEKQNLEENTRKKLHEMENAFAKATSQVEMANAVMQRLEVENGELSQEMEAARIRAEESAASCLEIARREAKTLKKFQSLGRQKAVFQEELTAEKHKVSQLQHQLQQTKEHYDQLEAKRKQEEKVKEGALLQAESERKEREQIEALAKLEDDSIRSKAEAELKRYKDDVRRLEHQIAKLRLTTDSSRIAALHWGIDSKARSVLEMINSQEFGACDVQRDRECVMCLTEEMSVVFLPCAHQIVCTKCNELHQKRGMKECPSCRAPIHHRICVRSADS